MIGKIFHEMRKRVRRLVRKYSAKARRKKLVQIGLAGATVLLISGYAFVQGRPTMIVIDPAAYGPLLNTIAKGESRGNYNAYFGNASNNTIRFTDMTVGEVLQWQADYVEQGSVSSAVGKYQIIRPTMLELVDKLQIDTARQRFDEALQDKMAIALLERRGSIRFVNGEMQRDEFAASLAKEWAALPKVMGANPHESYYASDGINKSNISVDEIRRALDRLATYSM